MENIDSLLRAKRAGELAMKSNQNRNNTTDRGGILSYGGAVWFFRILAILFLVVLLAVVFWRIPKFMKKSIRSNDDAREPEEVSEFSEAAMIQEIKDTESKNDFSGAVRWTYLLVLKKLSGKHYIQLAGAKTNAAYIRELDGIYGKQFGQLTATFESVWFGKKMPDPDKYVLIKNQFQTFMNEL